MTMKRQGNNLPWSGTRAAARKIVSNSSGEGPGPVMVLAEPDRRDSSKSRVCGAGRLNDGEVSDSMFTLCQSGKEQYCSYITANGWPFCGASDLR